MRTKFHLTVDKVDALGHRIWSFSEARLSPSGSYAMLVQKNGLIYVTGRREDELLILSPDGQKLVHNRFLGPEYYPRSISQFFSRPIAGDDGGIYISASFHDRVDHRVWQLHEDGSYSEVLRYSDGDRIKDEGILEPPVDHWGFNLVKINNSKIWMTVAEQQGGSIWPGNINMTYDRNSGEFDYVFVSPDSIRNKFRDETITNLVSNDKIFTVGYPWGYNQALYGYFYPIASQFWIYKSDLNLNLESTITVDRPGFSLVPHQLRTRRNGDLLLLGSFIWASQYPSIFNGFF